MSSHDRRSPTQSDGEDDTTAPPAPEEIRASSSSAQGEPSATQPQAATKTDGLDADVAEPTVATPSAPRRARALADGDASTSPAISARRAAHSPPASGRERQRRSRDQASAVSARSSSGSSSSSDGSGTESTLVAPDPQTLDAAAAAASAWIAGLQTYGYPPEAATAAAGPRPSTAIDYFTDGGGDTDAPGAVVGVPVDLDAVNDDWWQGVGAAAALRRRDADAGMDTDGGETPPTRPRRAPMTHASGVAALAALGEAELLKGNRVYQLAKTVRSGAVGELLLLALFATVSLVFLALLPFPPLLYAGARRYVPRAVGPLAMVYFPAAMALRGYGATIVYTRFDSEAARTAAIVGIVVIIIFDMFMALQTMRLCALLCRLDERMHELLVQGWSPALLPPVVAEHAD